MRFRWHEYAIYPLTFIGLTLALGIVGIGATLATIIIAMTKPLKSPKNFIISLAALALISGGVVWHYYTVETTLNEPTVSVTVTPDMSFGQLTDSLTNLGVIDKPKFFKIFARIRGIDKRLWVGRYDFSGEISVRNVLDMFATGTVAMTSVTIPEGLRIEQTAGLLSRAYELDSARIVRQAFDTLFCEERYKLPNLEGYLFPETYSFPIGVSLLDVLDKMVADTRRVVEQELQGADNFVLDEKEIIVMASIIEAEARVRSEQKTISAVYHNRLKKGMLMQADPTVRYGLGRFKRKLYFKHLRIATPYNTYMRKGLPPGAINSPGRQAIVAAIHPDESPYLYFVADGSGGHVFTETLSEHNRVKQKLKSEGKR